MSANKIDFHVNSWLKDKALQSCSLEAHGLWINIICLMQKSPIRGKLLSKKGEPIQASEIPDLIKKPKEIVDNLLQELIENKVIKIDSAGAFYSKKLLEVNERKKSSEPFYKESMDFYYDWHLEKFKVKPRIQPADTSGLKSILQHLSTMETEKYNRLVLFKRIFENWNKLDTYLQKATELRFINSNLTRILTDLMNTKQINKINKPTKLDAIIEENKKLDGFDFNTLVKK